MLSLFITHGTKPLPGRFYENRTDCKSNRDVPFSFLFRLIISRVWESPRASVSIPYLLTNYNDPDGSAFEHVYIRRLSSGLLDFVTKKFRLDIRTYGAAVERFAGCWAEERATALFRLRGASSWRS